MDRDLVQRMQENLLGIGNWRRSICYEVVHRRRTLYPAQSASTTTLIAYHYQCCPIFFKRERRVQRRNQRVFNSADPWPWSPDPLIYPHLIVFACTTAQSSGVSGDWMSNSCSRIMNVGLKAQNSQSSLNLFNFIILPLSSYQELNLLAHSLDLACSVFPVAFIPRRSLVSTNGQGANSCTQLGIGSQLQTVGLICETDFPRILLYHLYQCSLNFS